MPVSPPRGLKGRGSYMERVKSTFQVYRPQGLENDELVAVRLDLMSDSLSSLVFVLLRVETLWGKWGGGGGAPAGNPG